MTNRNSHLRYEKRPIETPKGRFLGLREASDAHEISRQAVSSKCRRRVPGWRFLDTPPATNWLSWNVEDNGNA